MDNLFVCPHCDTIWQITEIKCGIVRCGVFKQTWEQIPPHLDEKACESIKTIIWGCSRPFRIINGKVEKCDYI